jgi:hypothetical protein
MDVALRITRIPSAADAARKRLPFATIDSGDIVVTSTLPCETPLNEHLVWFWGLLKHERRFLKSLVGQGAAIAIYARGVGGRIEVKPNGAEMLHLLGADLIIE